MITTPCTRSRSEGDQAEGSGPNWGVRCAGWCSHLGWPKREASNGFGLYVSPLIGLLLIPPTGTKSPAQNYSVICGKVVPADGKSIVLPDFYNRLNANAHEAMQ